MSRQTYELPLDPAVAVSRLLTRLGFFVLVVFAPLLAMFSRRGVSVFVPIATALLILAAALDGRLGVAFSRFGRVLVRPPTLAFLALLIWAAVSMLWAPQPGPVPGHLISTALTLLLFAGAIACLQERVRSSDVNLIPIGVTLAAVALAFEFAPHSPLRALVDADMDGLESQRAAMMLSLLIWPAVVSLTWKARNWQALALCLVTAAALWLVHDLVVIAAFLAGAIAFLLVTWRPRAGAIVIGAVVLAFLVLAPLVGWVMARWGGFLLPKAGDALVAVWRDVTFSLPTRLLTGFGYDSSVSLVRGSSGVLLGSPRNAALQIWLELGLVGVVLAGLTLGLALVAAERIDEKARPAALAVFMAAGVMMFSGLASWQGWWQISVGLTAISLAFVARLVARARRASVR